MSQTEDILSTLRMVKQENLDVRTVTMGINLVRLRRQGPGANPAS